MYAGVYQAYNGSDSETSTFSINSQEDNNALAQEPSALCVAIKLER